MRRSSVFPWTYLESLVGGWRERRDFADVEKYVMFIGQPRSGTSLIGSLLNAHPNIWIAQELNALRYVARGYGRAQLFWLLKRRDEEFSQGGRKWTGYDYSIEGQYQGRCQTLQVIGDKKAGLSSELLGRQPELMVRLRHLVRVPIRMFHIVRNPFNVITTIHRKRKRTTLPLAIKMYFNRCATNWQLMQDPECDIMTVRLEDLIADARPMLSEMCAFLGQDASKDYLDACADKLFCSPRQSQLAIEWPTAAVDEVTERMQQYPFLNEYQFAGQLAKAA